MGYTHYFTFKPAPKGTAELVEKRYQAALRECQRLVKAYNSTAEGDARLSGYSAHTKLGAYGGLDVNGKGDNAHEPFTLREHYSQNVGSNFCKTAYKPYDTVVVACLALLKYRLGDLIEIGSDGSREDWALGVLFAAIALRRRIGNPITQSDYQRHSIK